MLRTVTSKENVHSTFIGTVYFTQDAFNYCCCQFTQHMSPNTSLSLLPKPHPTPAGLTSGNMLQAFNQKSILSES